MAIRIGTSGWVYPHWRGLIYPPALPQREWFRYYATLFDTVEINNSFYRLPGETTFAAWREQAPPGFLYAVKASRYLTHMRKLKEPEEPLDCFFTRAVKLGSILGPILYQLPPRWRVNLPRFEHFLAALPPGYQHVVEFREPSWLHEDLFRLMEQSGVAHCLHDMPPLQVPLRVTAPPVYIRFHGDPAHGGNYPQETLEVWATRIADWQRQGLDIFVYFNNDIGGYAVQNAQTLKSLV
ncbi:MAG: DUF72 domain-containing protein [Chloroflexi bacterium]|nr:MAG: DUF72 domain-containing protein [Chloroflexota bacterium]